MVLGTTITSLYFSKLYHGSKVWHILERTTSHDKQLKYARANALWIIDDEMIIYHTHMEIHRLTKRALPDQTIIYKHVWMLNKLPRQFSPSDEFVQLNFQANLNPRQQHHNFLKIQNNNISRILNIYIILLCTHLYHTSFRYLSITCIACIACHIKCKKI